MRRRRFHKRNPLTSTEDLLVAGAGIAVLSLVGFAVYAKNKSASATTAANPFINAPQSPQQQAWAAGVNAGLSPTACPPGTAC